MKIIIVIVSESNSGMVLLSNSKFVWENYLDKYNLLKDANGNDTSQKLVKLKKSL